MSRRLACEKANCPAEGSILVTLEAADGSFAWWACPEHAEAFKVWVGEESERQGDDWGYVEAWSEPTIEWLNAGLLYPSVVWGRDTADVIAREMGEPTHFAHD